MPLETFMVTVYCLVREALNMSFMVGTRASEDFPQNCRLLRP
ncbi:hypothetical protein ACCUM_3438 [Candidatus Accumulibacter phosphatis]|uniref:Uncharacterized protein n=2 Tax=Candidatus Accumulibacter TaxID=327159 RepID=A0A080MDI5_9PROT|nr:MAG: hypothetical protein AW06_003661 [Candidatus Accumulibacter cognatus]TMQ77221.1 hypothetical protein ACCUM_3438 [Candidatus Accumulibacter phosphatis]